MLRITSMSNQESFLFLIFVLKLYLTSSVSAEFCAPCAPTEYLSDNGQCMPCPQGLWCRGNTVVESKIINSTWDLINGIYTLSVCPIGYHLSYDALADSVAKSKSQKCELCQQGHECTSPPCQSCTPCKPGFYKENMYTGSCLRCPADTYNELEGGEDLETSCIKCPDQSSTNGKKGASNINDCKCKESLYTVMMETANKNELICTKCPTGAVCSDGTCALRSPGRYCNQSQDVWLGDLSEWDGAKWVDVSSRVQGTVPTSRRDAGVAIINGFLYMHGGLGSSGGTHPVCSHAMFELRRHAICIRRSDGSM
jgi:hypothetical protein